MYGFTIEAFYRACDYKQVKNVRVGTFKHQMIKWKLGISDKNMNRIVAVLDEDKNRIISYDELQFALEAYQCAGEDTILDSSGLTYSFKAVFKLVKLIQERGLTVEGLFNMIDIDKNEKLELSEMNQAVGVLGDFKIKEVHMIYNFLDIDNTGRIDKDEFISQMNRANTKYKNHIAKLRE